MITTIAIIIANAVGAVFIFVSALFLLSVVAYTIVRAGTAGYYESKLSHTLTLLKGIKNVKKER